MYFSQDWCLLYRVTHSRFLEYDEGRSDFTIISVYVYLFSLCLSNW